MALVGSPIGKPWGRRLPVSVGGVVGKTYADFQAHISTLATNGVSAWNGVSFDTGAWRVTASSTPSGVMYGSPWQSQFTSNGTLGAVNRVVQHALPSLAEVTAQVSATREMFVRIQQGPLEPYISITRNGYTSLASDPPNQTDGGAERTCTELIYWDGVQAQRMQPSLGLGPAPYTW